MSQRHIYRLTRHREQCVTACEKNLPFLSFDSFDFFSIYATSSKLCQGHMAYGIAESAHFVLTNFVCQKRCHTTNFISIFSLLSRYGSPSPSLSLCVLVGCFHPNRSVRLSLHAQANNQTQYYFHPVGPKTVMPARDHIHTKRATHTHRHSAHNPIEE